MTCTNERNHDNLKGLTHAHTKRMTVLALGDVGAKIDMILLAQFEPGAAAKRRKERGVSEELIRSGNDFSNTAKCNQAESLGQRQPILQLCCDHVPIQISAGC